MIKNYSTNTWLVAYFASLMTLNILKGKIMLNTTASPFYLNGYQFIQYNGNLVQWSGVSGVYIFLSAQRSVIYVGKTSDFYQRFANHEKIPLAQGYGLKSIYITPILTEAARDALEKHLIGFYSPPLNIKQKYPQPLGLGIQLFSR